MPLRADLEARGDLEILNLGKEDLETLSFGSIRARNGLNAGMQLHITPISISIVLRQR